MNGELNKKIAKWLGLCYHEWEVVNDTTAFPYSRCRKCMYCGLEYSTDSDEYQLPKFAKDDPYFDESLDACFEYIVPKLDRYRIENDWSIIERHFAYAEIGAVGEQEWNNSPALALCLAVEKLIDA